MQTMKIRRVGALSLGKILGVLYAVAGLLLGLVFSIAGMFGAAIGMSQQEGPGAALLGLLFGVGAIVILPLVYGTMGFIVGLIVAVVYNIVARMAGGIELDLEAQPAAGGAFTPLPPPAPATPSGWQAPPG